MGKSTFWSSQDWSRVESPWDSPNKKKREYIPNLLRNLLGEIHWARIQSDLFVGMTYEEAWRALNRFVNSLPPVIEPAISEMSLETLGRIIDYANHKNVEPGMRFRGEVIRESSVCFRYLENDVGGICVGKKMLEIFAIRVLCAYANDHAMLYHHEVRFGLGTKVK